MLNTFLLTVNNIKSDMIRDFFTSLMGAKPLKGVFEQIMQLFVAPTKKPIRHTRIAFPHISYAIITKKPSDMGYDTPIFSVQMCTQIRLCVHGSYAHGSL